MVTLSRPLLAAVPEDRSQHRAGILFDRHVGSAGIHHFLRALQKFVDIEAHQRRGHHAEIRQRRVAPADARHTVEDVAKAIGLGHLLHLRAGIGDGDEVAAALPAPLAFSARSKKYCLKMLGSSVEPDLLETMNSVFARSILLSKP